MVSSWTRGLDLHEPRREAAEASATACAHTLSRAFTSLGSSPAQFAPTNHDTNSTSAQETKTTHQDTFSDETTTIPQSGGGKQKGERFATKQKRPGPHALAS